MSSIDFSPCLLRRDKLKVYATRNYKTFTLASSGYVKKPYLLIFVSHPMVRINNLRLIWTLRQKNF